MSFDKKRIPHIDVLKGILITLVVWGHIVYVIQLSTGAELTSIVWRLVSNISKNMIAPYYMGAFFIVTGYCSGFKRKFREQIYNDFKRLIVPSFFVPFVMCIFLDNPLESFLKQCNNILFGKVAWFLVAMFISRGLFNLIINKCTNKILCAIIFTFLSVLGCWLINRFPEYNVCWIFHALSFIVFIFIGYMVKRIGWSYFAGMLFVCLYVIILMFFRITHMGMPALCEIITFSTSLWPAFIILTVIGTYIMSLCAYSIRNCVFLQYLGKHSLVLYLTHITFIKLYSRTIADYIVNNCSETIPAITVFFSMLLGSILWGCMWAYIFNTRYFKWIVGEF